MQAVASLNIYVAEQDMALVRRFAKRLKRQRMSLSKWFCLTAVEYLEKQEAVEKLLVKDRERV